MKIRKLHLKNIGVFNDETIEFQPCPNRDKAEIHIFTGENGTGKTTLLMALASGFNPHKGVSSFQLDELVNNFYKRFVFGEDRIKVVLGFDNQTELNLSFNKGGGLLKLTEDNSKFYLPGLSPISIFTLKQYKEILLAQKFEPSLYGFNFATFAFSGYRQVTSEKIEALYEPNDFNPLSQSLNFIKKYNEKDQISINQLIANNISKSAIEKDRNKDKSERFAKVITSIEEIIREITGWDIKFDMQTEPVNLITKINASDLEFDVLPDGLRSLISWLADLLGRVDMLKWQDDLPIFEKNLILLLDEIEVHLHPAWQRKVLPVIQKYFKNSQIFLSTHSPFVINSVDDAWVYRLELEDGKAKVADVVESENSNSITQVLREVFGIEEWFGLEVQNNLERFKKLKQEIISNGADESVEKELLEKARTLADEPNDQLKQIVKNDLRELSEIKNKSYEI